jgi:ADP-heptose:LPS heptosyltransferase
MWPDAALGARGRRPIHAWMAPKPFPILFITGTRIGDAVLSTGLLKKLSEEIPNARFTVVAGAPAAPLFAEIPTLDRLIVMEKARSGGHWLKLWNQVRGKSWGLVVDLRGSAIANLVRTKRRAVRRKSALAGLEPEHKVIEAARLLKLQDEPPSPFIFTSAETEARADAMMGEARPILAVGPAANWMGKMWPVERFAHAAMQLLSEGGPLAGGRLAIFGGPDDTRLVEGLRNAVPRERRIDLTGNLDLVTAYACLKRCDLFIGNDSGLMHLAAAADIPTIGLFGPSDERLYGPWGSRTRAVRGPRTFEQFLQVDPKLSNTVTHMYDLPIALVVEAACELLAEPVALLPAPEAFSAETPHSENPDAPDL